jgi:hypothetical protein
VTSPVAQVVPYAVIEEYLATKVVTDIPKNTKTFSSFFEYGNEEKQGKLYDYVWAVIENYSFKNNKLQKVKTLKGPFVLVIEKQDEVYKKITAHQSPRGGSWYKKDVQQLFPKAVAETLLKSNSAREELLVKEVHSKANIFFRQGSPTSLTDLQKQKCLDYTFEEYGVNENFSSYAAEINASSTIGIDEATLKQIYKNYNYTTNFAGHYTLVSWSCGKTCQKHAIINNKDGRIVAYGLQSAYGVDFKVTSRLLVVNPYAKILNPSPNGVTTYYEVLNDNSEFSDLKPEIVPLCSYTDPGTTIRDYPSATEPATSTVTHPTGTLPTSTGSKRYVSRSKEDCTVMLIRCREGEQVFVDDEGCGCEPAGP